MEGDFRHGWPAGGAAYTRIVRMREPVPTFSRFLRWTVFATCAVAALPMVLEIFRRPELMLQPRYVAWLAALAGFVAALVLSMQPGVDRQPSMVCRGLLVAQSVLGLALVALAGDTIPTVFLVLVAAQLRPVVELRAALVWTALQTAVLAVLLAAKFGATASLVFTGVFAGFQLFALYSSHTAASERQAREELARAHESLLATRGLLAESTRTAERLRIARELHDVLGHHLTALSLQLEAALHAPEPAARERVAIARRLAGDLLREVRGVVSTLREEPQAPVAGLEERLAAALAALGAGLEEPLVHLAVQPGVEVADPGLAHALVRCAEEAFTNAARHAGAHNLWLDVERAGEGVTLRARDDGRGAAPVVPGNGLRGMRERIEGLGGRLDLASPVSSGSSASGFELTAWLPLAGVGVGETAP